MAGLVTTTIADCLVTYTLVQTLLLITNHCLSKLFTITSTFVWLCTLSPSGTTLSLLMYRISQANNTLRPYRISQTSKMSRSYRISQTNNMYMPRSCKISQTSEMPRSYRISQANMYMPRLGLVEYHKPVRCLVLAEYHKPLTHLGLTEYHKPLTHLGLTEYHKHWHT